MRALVLLLLLIGTSDAQELRSLAREKFDQGRIEFAAQHYEKALGLFRDSYQLAPYPDLLFNIARCNEALHHFRDALDAYERYLAVNPKDEEARRRADDMRHRSLEEPLPVPDLPPEPSPSPLPSLAPLPPSEARPTP